MQPIARLFLDVDGVLNAVTGKPPKFWGGDWRKRNINGFPIRWAPAVPAFIRSLHPKVEILWLTTWGFDAHLLDSVMDLPDFPVAGESKDFDGPEWWKLTVMQSFPHNGVPFIWADDDIRFDEDAQDWLGSLTAGTWLAISPNTHEGIHPRHVEQISTFVEALEAG